MSGGQQGFTSGILIGAMDKDCNREMSVCPDRLVDAGIGDLHECGEDTREFCADE